MTTNRKRMSEGMEPPTVEEAAPPAPSQTQPQAAQVFGGGALFGDPFAVQQRINESYAPRAQPPMQRGTVPGLGAPPAEEIPEPKRYIVTGIPRSETVLSGGHKVKIVLGKVLDERYHDVPKLRQQGVQVRQLKADEELF